MTKDFTSLQIDQKHLPVPMVETKPTIAAVMPAAAMEQPFMGNYPFFPPFSSLPFPLPGDRGQMFPMFDNLSQHVYPTAAHRWPMQDYQDPKAVCMDTQFYSMPFQLPPPPAMEPYPVDPCPSTVPSTSVAPTQVEYKPIDYVMSRNPAAAAYNYNMLQYGDFASPQAITANWKAAAMKGSNSSKSDIPPPKHRTGPGTNNVRVRTQDTYRVVYTDAQRTELELEYQSQPFISADRKAELSGRLNLTERQVKIWFQNRRAKDRRDKRNKN